MSDPRGNVKKIEYKVGKAFKVFLDTQATALVAEDSLVQQALAVVLAVQEEVTLPLKDGRILRVERANEIPPPGTIQPPSPGSVKITGIATQVNAQTGKSFFEIFVVVNNNPIQYSSSDPAIQALCLTACGRDSSLKLMADRDNVITEAIFECPTA